MARKSQSTTVENNMNNTTKGVPGSNNGSKEKTEGKQTLLELFEKTLSEACSCEKQLVDALEDMSKAAYSEELQDAFKQHKEQTERHLERVKKIQDRLHIEKDEEPETNKVIETLVEIGKKVISEYGKGPVCDAALIMVAQKVEHVEIALYGSLCEFADVLGYHKVIDILERTLEEERMTDEHLSDIAKEVNDEACEMSPEEVHEY